VERARSIVGQSWSGGVMLAVTTGIAYFLAARLGQVLSVEPGLAIFWPASGISVGVLIALGPRVRLPVAAAVLVGSTACGLAIGRSAWLSIAFGFLNALQTILTAWLLEQSFGRMFKLEDVRSVLGFPCSDRNWICYRRSRHSDYHRLYKINSFPSPCVGPLVRGVHSGGCHGCPTADRTWRCYA
jgi:MASE1